MDIKDKITPEDKQQLSNLGLECQVLGQLCNERQAIMGKKADEILASIGLSPKTYALKFNPAKDLWEAVLKESALVVPGQETRGVIKGG